MSTAGFIITRFGVVAVEGGAASIAALKQVGTSIADDVAFWGDHASNVNDFVSAVQTSLNDNGLGSMKIVGAAAFGTAASLTVAATMGTVLGAAAIAFGVGLGASWLYGSAFDQAKTIGDELVWEDPSTPPNSTPNYPLGDANSNGIPDIHESIKNNFDIAKIIRPTSPIVFDLDGDGVETTKEGSKVTRKALLIARLLSFYFCICVLPIKAQATTFEEMHQGFMHCELGGVYLDVLTKKPMHSYFTERNMKPYKILDGFAYYKVKEKLYHLPVDEVAIPASTFAVYSLFINLPLPQARKIIKDRFGSEFRPNKVSRDGLRPELIQDEKRPKRSVMVCWNQSGL